MGKKIITIDDIERIGFTMDSCYKDEGMEFKIFSYKEIEIDFVDDKFMCIELLIDRNGFKIKGINTISDIEKLKSFIYGPQIES